MQLKQERLEQHVSGHEGHMLLFEHVNIFTAIWCGTSVNDVIVQSVLRVESPESCVPSVL